MFQIGEFSIIARLSIKTLRHYHDEGILVPDYVDEESGYRYYRESSVERARVIGVLRGLEFSISEIREMLTNYSEDEEVVVFLERQRGGLMEKARQYRDMGREIEAMIESIRRNEMKHEQVNDILEKRLDDMIFAGHRFKGKYAGVGKAFGIVGRRAGRHIAGSAMSLYYDGEFRETDADIEAGFPVSKTVAGEGISCRVLPGCRAVTLVHRGPYENLGEGYAKIFAYLEEKKLRAVLPTREVYIKGPGMIFRGNPQKYVTEIQVPVE